MNLDPLGADKSNSKYSPSPSPTHLSTFNDGWLHRVCWDSRWTRKEKVKSKHSPSGTHNSVETFILTLLILHNSAPAPGAKGLPLPNWDLVQVYNTQQTGFNVFHMCMDVLTINTPSRSTYWYSTEANNIVFSFKLYWLNNTFWKIKDLCMGALLFFPLSKSGLVDDLKFLPGRTFVGCRSFGMPVFHFILIYIFFLQLTFIS